MYIAVNTVNNTVLYICKLLREEILKALTTRGDPKSSHHQKKICNDVRWWIFTKLWCLFCIHLHTYLHTFIKSLCCAPEMNRLSVNYISIFKISILQTEKICTK